MCTLLTLLDNKILEVVLKDIWRYNYWLVIKIYKQYNLVPWQPGLLSFLSLRCISSVSLEVHLTGGLDVCAMVPQNNLSVVFVFTYVQKGDMEAVEWSLLFPYKGMWAWKSAISRSAVQLCSLWVLTSTILSAPFLWSELWYICSTSNAIYFSRVFGRVNETAYVNR